MLRVLGLSFLTALLFAQGTTSRIVGLITDPTGAAVPNAKVKLTNELTNVSFESTSSASGNYQFDSVQIGTYRIEVEASGFKKFVARENQLTVGEPLTLNIPMQLGTVSDAVEVTAAAELVQTNQSGNIGPLVNERTMKEMPIVATRRRDPTSILTYVPGMNSGSNTGSGGHMNGARDRAWNFTLDGVDMNETSAGGGVGNNPIRVNPDSVAEMKIVTANASAEYGRNSGGQVALVTRSGTNELHGNAYWFYRTPALNANPWQNNFNRVGKEQFVQNI
ncbi:MAG: carboxypeptidase regulatory-like domain-containing protein, partial [Bryobacteraceae bacterium]